MKDTRISKEVLQRIVLKNKRQFLTSCLEDLFRIVNNIFSLCRKEKKCKLRLQQNMRIHLAQGQTQALLVLPTRFYIAVSSVVLQAGDCPSSANTKGQRTIMQIKEQT